MIARNLSELIISSKNTFDFFSLEFVSRHQYFGALWIVKFSTLLITNFNMQNYTFFIFLITLFGKFRYDVFLDGFNIIKFEDVFVLLDLDQNILCLQFS